MLHTLWHAKRRSPGSSRRSCAQYPPDRGAPSTVSEVTPRAGAGASASAISRVKEQTTAMWNTAMGSVTRTGRTPSEPSPRVDVSQRASSLRWRVARK